MLVVDMPRQVSSEIDHNECVVVPSNVDEMFDKPATVVVESTEEILAAVNEAAGVKIEIETTEDDDTERRWWAKVEVLSKIRDCSRLIQETESEIDGYQDQIKEAKEVLKGQQALLNRYSSQLADILDGHPLPKNPNAATAETIGDGSAAPVNEVDDLQDWRDYPTSSLLAGVKGMGAKKLDAIVEDAPTVGRLEDLRGQASISFKHFKEVLPKGFGEELCERIEQKLEDYIRDWNARGSVEVETSSVKDSQEYEDVE